MNSYNRRIADRLEEVAQILTEQDANVFRIEAYRRAARTIRNLDEPVSETVRREGILGLQKLPWIGKNIARSIYYLVTSGRLPMLQRLRGESDPVEILSTVPGIGRILANRIHQDFGIETLEELEAAANDGRLANIEGFGRKRLAGIRDSLSARLARIRHGSRPNLESQPTVRELLDVDQEYRMKVAVNSLPKIAPRRFNPRKEAWLPILHTVRGTRHYTALFSNTAHAHKREKTHDWVILYYETDEGESQCTVITAGTGPLKGFRIVRGREDECMTESAQLLVEQA